MRLVSWNVNGIRAVHKKGLLAPLIDGIKPDVLCLQETKAQQHQSEVDWQGFHEYWNSAVKPGYSGTAIFSKIEPKKVILGLPEHLVQKFHVRGDTYGDPNAEGRVIAAEYEHFYLVTVYTPNSKDDLSRIPLRHNHGDPAFLAYCEELERHGSTRSPHGKPVIFCGDLNVAHTADDLANPKPNEGKKGFTQQEREGIDNMIAAGFVETFRLFKQGNGHYTWWSHFANARARNVGWRIDYFFASKSLVPHITKAEILPSYMGSDHCPILLELDFKA